MEITKTISEWDKIFNVEIMDPDGFDREDPWLHKKLFTRAEFEHGMNRSTCKFNAKSIWSGVITNNDEETMKRIQRITRGSDQD